MKLKNNKGFVGVDTSIAIIILLIFIPTISAIIYNINKENNNVQRKAQALNFAVNVMEIAKGIEPKELTMEKLETEITEFYKLDTAISNTNMTDGTINITKDKISYNLILSIKDYNEIDNTVEQNKAKQVKVIVTYLSGGKEQKIELETAVS